MTAIDQIAQEIGISSAYLKNMSRNCDKLYKVYYIEKNSKSGNLRAIEAPNKHLKGIQAWILRNVLDTVQVSSSAHGFVKGRNIKSNASVHLGQRYILVLDIKDFFPSIGIDKVFPVFFEITKYMTVSTVYSDLCTYKSRLPQGGVTSPALSNLVFRPVDAEIEQLCSKLDVGYSRYADDLTFSSNDFNALKDVEKNAQELIVKAGYDLNDKKTRYLSPKSKMLVTGLRLNAGTTTTGQARKREIRSALYNYIVKKDKSVDINRALGNIAFIRGIEPDYYSKIEKYVEQLKVKSSQLSD